MKVTNIKYTMDRYFVTLSPNWLERLFGRKEKLVMLKGTGKAYAYGGQGIYIYQDGTTTSSGCDISEAIDKFNNKWS